MAAALPSLMASLTTGSYVSRVTWARESAHLSYSLIQWRVLVRRGSGTDASSQEVKENIRDLSADEAMEALQGLNAVDFNYKADASETRLGFIAEDVPDSCGL